MANEKRLTWKRSLDGYTDVGLRKGVTAYEAICKLADYEEAEADAADSIVPPVKIGQVLWCIIPHSEIPLECRVYCICREERNGLVLDYFRCVVRGWFAKAFSFEDVGKTIFLTEAEALAKMDGGNEDA